MENRFLFESAGDDVDAVQVDDLLLGGREGSCSGVLAWVEDDVI